MVHTSYVIVTLQSQIILATIIEKNIFTVMLLASFKNILLNVVLRYRVLLF